MSNYAIVTADTITDDQIDALRNEAEAHGDAAQVRICERALDGHTGSRALCAEAINDARAMDDDGDDR